MSATATTAVTALLGRSALASASGPGLHVDDVVAAAVLAVAALATGVMSVGLLALTLSTTARALGGSLRAADSAARRLTPAVMRRVVTAGLGVGLGLSTAVSAHATEPDLLWVVTEEAGAEGPAAARAVASTSSDTGANVPSTSGGLGRAVATTHVPAEPDDGHTAPEHVEVRQGDTLWSIASTRLGPDTSDHEIALEWPRWYDANRDVVGDDPDHIEPGQVLVAPGEGDR